MTAARPLAPAMIGALGVVYGDIGTSPLYALREAVAASGSPGTDVAAVFGVLSLIFWSLALVVTLKYVVVILRADNDGEGGILALLALVQRKLDAAGPWAARVAAIAMLGTALFYCDALITPAISILSAVEGLKTLDPGLSSAVIPLTLIIIAALFAIQKHGTGRIGRMFGPIMVVWFATLGALGAMWIARNPSVLAAVHPRHAVALLATHPALALVILGAVFLAVTGAEALYADMGHFGKRPVRLAWIAIVWPGLLLNYFGQAAMMLGSPATVQNPFFEMAPAPMLPLLVLLATAATIIASQATISGAFSITRQAVQLDLLPRLRIAQTSPDEPGQIYVPAANLFMAIAVVLFVLAFGSSGALAAAYGTSVVGTMLVTTLLGALVFHRVWGWPWWKVVPLFLLFAVVDLAFVAGNATKVADGGWVPLLLAACMFGLFLTWRDGRQRLRAALQERAVPLATLPELVRDAVRVPGAAVFLVSDPDFVPTALLRNLAHNRVYHAENVILHLEIVRQPRVDPLARTRVETVMPGTTVLHARFGFMETPSATEALRSARRRGLRLEDDGLTYFVGWHLVRAIPHARRSARLALFAWMQRRSAQAAEFFRMPAAGVIVLATEIELR